MTALHQYQSRASLPRRRLAGVKSSLPLSVAFQHGVDRVPIATRLFHSSRKLACQGQFSRVYRKLLKHFQNHVSEALHCHFSNRPFVGRPSVGFDANENGLTYAKILFASGAKEND